MNIIRVFADGACRFNGKYNAKAGIGIHFPNNEFDDISEIFTSYKVTNQRAELFAIYKAVTIITSDIQFDKIIIYTDSKYSIDCITKWIHKWKKNNWISSNNKPVLNLDLIKPLHNLISQYENKIILRHVKAHTDNKDYYSIGNRYADNLATSAISI